MLLKLWPFFVFGKVSPPAVIGLFIIKVGRQAGTPKGHPDRLISLLGTPKVYIAIDKIYRQPDPFEVLERQGLYDGLSYSSKRQYAPERQL
jgi:hypothetical protein